MTTPITRAQIVRRAWQIRPTLLETLGIVALIVLAHVLLGLPLVPGFLFTTLMVALVATAIAVSELRAEAQDGDGREGEVRDAD